MANWNAITTEQIADMKELRAQGFTNKEIQEKLGLGHATVSRHLPKKFSHPILKSNAVDDMLTYRELGLSNKQIALEMGLSYSTVVKKIGPQPIGLRSEYGSIVSHATGESFAAKAAPVQKKEESDMPKAIGSALELVQNTVEFKGKVASYKINMQNVIEIKVDDGRPLDFLAPYQISDLIAELKELQVFFDSQRN